MPGGIEDVEAQLFSLRRTPTVFVLRALRLPRSWENALVRFRVPLHTALMYRRHWLYELVLLVGTVSTAVAAILTWFAVPSVAGYWLAASLIEFALLILVYRFSFPGLGLIVLSPALLGGHVVLLSGDSTKPYVVLAAMLVAVTAASITERVPTVLGIVGYALVSVALAYGVSRPGYSGSVAEAVEMCIALTITAVIAMAGMVSWRILVDGATAALIANRALTEQITAVRDRVERSNQELAELNGQLEERVAERTRELHELSIRDELTGLYNRRHFVARLTETAQSQLPYAVLMLDLDHFKSINDRFGHAAGDLVLREVSETLRHQLRDGDVLARVGGEEFGLIVGNSAIDPASPDASWPAELARRLCERVRAQDWSEHGLNLAATTVSIGVAASGITGNDPDLVMRRADAALYAAKKAGRDRVRLADHLPKQQQAEPSMRRQQTI
ncbi:MAG: hypothetical protein CSA58_04460 [Micrococcales bacterium]|nr:MAG: hypothetical protein CSB46_03955 [Micrococcales bacterium]PIE27395.1 MAG: hypothetical protein CSA58_04460 [Micrococcales bacterium]